jgi:hypothetical protein
MEIGSSDFPSARTAMQSPLAKALFSVDGMCNLSSSDLGEVHLFFFFFFSSIVLLLVANASKSTNQKFVWRLGHWQTLPVWELRGSKVSGPLKEASLLKRNKV